MAVFLAFSRAPLTGPNRCDSPKRGSRRPPQSDGATGPPLSQAETSTAPSDRGQHWPSDASVARAQLPAGEAVRFRSEGRMNFGCGDRSGLYVWCRFKGSVPTRATEGWSSRRSSATGSQTRSDIFELLLAHRVRTRSSISDRLADDVEHLRRSRSGCAVLPRASRTSATDQTMRRDVPQLVHIAVDERASTTAMATFLTIHGQVFAASSVAGELSY